MEHGLGLDVRFDWDKAGIEIGADWLNFTHVQYEVVRGYPMPGSNYRVHLRCRF